MGDDVSAWGDGGPEEPQQTPESAGGVTRRHLLHLGLMGGASALLAQQVTQRVVQGQADEDWVVAKTGLRTKAAAELATVQTSMQARIDRLEQELALYRALERSGLDSLITVVLDTWNGAWRGIRSVVQRLGTGIDSIDEKLQTWEERLVALREALRGWGGLLDGAERHVEQVRVLLAAISEGTEAIGDAIDGFFDWVLDRVPFGWGDDLRAAADGVAGLIRQVPQFIGDSREQILVPITEDWTSEEEETGLRGMLLQPLRLTLLMPLKEHVTQLESLAESWEERTGPSLREALADREVLRTQIADMQARDPIALSSEIGINA